MNRLLKIFFVIMWCAMHLHISAQNSKDSIRSRYFKQRDFGKYFISDIYSPTPQIQAGAGLNLATYNISPSRTNQYLIYNQTDFGAELPFFTKVKYNDGLLKYKFSISTPICARIWFDFTEPYTAPILNTDFQFAPFELHFLKNVNRKKFKNFSVKLVPFFHESSHMGDELTLYKRADSVYNVWVNVSYQTSEIAFTINDMNGKLANNTSVKLGLKFLLNPQKGWYSIRTEAGDTARSVPSHYWLESYLQLQNQATRSWLANDKFIRIASIEIRSRVQYGYPSFTTQYERSANWANYTNGERMNFSVNAYLGWKFNFSNHLVPRFGAYIKFYEGINPYGQFRNLSNYKFLGISLIYEN